MASAILVDPNGDPNKCILSSSATLDQERNDTKIASRPRKNLFRRTATTVYSAFNRSHGAWKKSESTATTFCCVADDDLTKGSKEDTIAASVSDLSCASTDGAHEDVSNEVENESKGSNDSDTTTTAVTTQDDDCTDKISMGSSEGTAAAEMEFYQGDGHTPRNFGDAYYPGNKEQQMDGSCSRAEWADARDGFDSIFEYPENYVATPRQQVASEDHQQVLDIDKHSITMECKYQDAMVAMNSPRSIFDNEKFDTTEAALEGRSTISETKMGEKLRPIVEPVCF